MNNQK